MGKVNKKLIGYRKMAGFSQDDMAQRLGIHRISYYRKEMGKSSFTELEMVKVSDILTSALKETVTLKINDIFF